MVSLGKPRSSLKGQTVRSTDRPRKSSLKSTSIGYAAWEALFKSPKFYCLRSASSSKEVKPSTILVAGSSQAVELARAPRRAAVSQRFAAEIGFINQRDINECRAVSISKRDQAGSRVNATLGGSVFEYTLTLGGCRGKPICTSSNVVIKLTTKRFWARS